MGFVIGGAPDVAMAVASPAIAPTEATRDDPADACPSKFVSDAACSTKRRSGWSERTRRSCSRSCASCRRPRMVGEEGEEGRRDWVKERKQLWLTVFAPKHKIPLWPYAVWRRDTAARDERLELRSRWS